MKIHWPLSFLLLFTEYKIIRKKRTDFNSFCETLNDMQHPIAFKNKWQTINMHFYVSPIWYYRNNYISVDFEMWFLFVCVECLFFGKKKVQKMSQNPNQYKTLDLMFVCFIGNYFAHSITLAQNELMPSEVSEQSKSSIKFNLMNCMPVVFLSSSFSFQKEMLWCCRLNKQNISTDSVNQIHARRRNIVNKWTRTQEKV